MTTLSKKKIINLGLHVSTAEEPIQRNGTSGVHKSSHMEPLEEYERQRKIITGDYANSLLNEKKKLIRNRAHGQK